MAVQVTSSNTDSKSSMNPLHIIKKVFHIYRKGFWKFWLIYLVSFALIKALMFSFYWGFNWLQDNTFVGFSLVESQYYVFYHEIREISTFDAFRNDETFLTRSFALYLFLDILYQSLLAIPLAISVLVAKNIFDKSNDPLKKQVRDVFILLGPILLIAIITNFLVAFSSAFWYIPGLIVMVFTSLVYPIILEERLKPIATIKRSFHIAKEQFFNILGVVIIVLLVQVVIFGIGKGFALLLVYEPAVADQLVTVYNSIYVLYQYELVQSLVYSIIAPFTAISAFVMYREAVLLRNLRLSAVVDSTTRFARSTQIGNPATAVNTQLKKVVLSETKSLIKKRFCSHCGHGLDDDSTFCDNCGTSQ